MLKVWRVEVDSNLSDKQVESVLVLASSEANAIMDAACVMNWNQCLLKATEVREVASRSEGRRIISLMNERGDE